MYTDYAEDNINVLQSFLDGFHGRSFLGIYSRRNPYKHMLRYRDLLMNNCSRYVADAVDAAKNERYNILTFL